MNNKKVVLLEAKDFLYKSHGNFVPLWHAVKVANAKIKELQAIIEEYEKNTQKLEEEALAWKDAMAALEDAYDELVSTKKSEK